MTEQINFNFNDEWIGENPNPTSHYGTNGESVAPSLNDSFEILNVSRPIHYLGSKLRLVKPILEVIDKLEPTGGVICDLFAGSGTVSKALSKRRGVIAVDIQEYSRVLCAALLQPPTVDVEILNSFWNSVRSSEHSQRLMWAVQPLVTYEAACLDDAAKGDLETLCDLVEHGSLIALEHNACGATSPSLRLALNEVSSRLHTANLMSGPAALAVRYYGGVYFSFEQAAKLDILLEAVETLPKDVKKTFLAAVLSTASEVVNTVGKQFAQPLRPRTADGKPKKNLYQLVARDRFVDSLKLYENWLKRYLSIPKPSQPNQVIRQDYAEALDDLKGQVSIVYADPPYTRDHYSRFYHVLETFCLRDNPTVSTVRINGQERLSRGFYRLERHQSPFCIKTQAPKAFSTLFEKTRQLNVPLVLSYSPYEKQSGARPRLLTVEEIENLAKQFFRQVEVSRAGRIAHNKLNHAQKNVGVTYNAEVLVICVP